MPYRRRHLSIVRPLEDRTESADRRDEAADVCDHVARGRADRSSSQDSLGEAADEDAGARDPAAAGRDAFAEEQGLAWKQWLDSMEASGMTPAVLDDMLSAARSADEERECTRRGRTAAGPDGAGARAARLLSGRDRLDPGEDRAASSRDREERGDRDDSVFDGLTSAYPRESGLVELAREISRARALGTPLSIAHLDLDDLDVAEPDTDRLPIDRNLALVLSRLHEQLKPYAIVVRMGGGKLLCVLPGEDHDTASRVLDDFRTAAGILPGPGMITVGIAQLGPADSALGLVARAKRLTRPAPLASS